MLEPKPALGGLSETEPEWLDHDGDGLPDWEEVMLNNRALTEEILTRTQELNFLTTADRSLENVLDWSNRSANYR